MRGKERTVVAIILLAALLLGLRLVKHGLGQVQMDLEASLSVAQFNSGGSLPGETVAEAAGEAAEALAAAGDGGDSETAGDTKALGDTDAAFNTAEQSDAGALPDEDSAVQQGDQTVEGSASFLDVLPAELGETPSLGGGGEVGLESLIAWMQSESSGALTAQTRLAAEKALASGLGSEGDELRRTFAQSQNTANDQARQNLLAEEAAALGLDYLKYRDLLALRKESVAFYQALEAGIKKELDADKSRTEDEAVGPSQRLLADQQTVQDLLAAEELALAAAEADLEAAAQALNVAVGNPAGTRIAVTGELKQDNLPTISGDKAAALALEARNEVREAAYILEREKQALNRLRYEYPPTAPEFLSQQSALEEAQAAYPRIRSIVEADVRNRLTRLQLSAQDLALINTVLERSGNAGPEPVYKLEQDQDQAWFSNLSTLSGQWAERLSSRVRLITGTARFNLDILYFDHAVGAGCTAAAI